MVSRTVLGPRLVEYELDSPVLGERTMARILFPADYAANPATRYPVLYLLHGGGDDFRSWTDKGEATESTADLPLIVVMPEARNGFYSDWVKAGAHGRTPWESHHVGELIPWVDRTFRTIADRGGRALAGLSMGGFGAMSYAARHPDLFTAAASFSGVLDTNRHTWIPGIAAQRDGGPPDAIWGSRLTREMRWRAHNPWDLAANLRGMWLSVRTGTGVPSDLDKHPKLDLIEAIVCHWSVRLHRKFTELGIEHDWYCGRGTHDWPYWARDLRVTLPSLMKTFADPPPAPNPLSYTSAEPEYSVAGWTVRSRRMREAFSTLSSAHRAGFSLTGVGMADVRTATWYEPGRAYRVWMAGPFEHRTMALKADGVGSLTMNVRLGPFGLGGHTVHVAIAEDCA
ncbi:alpha/beta hydrolase [Amycolatopsis anabasis]|uniref:alpha/beta hydrolase n=1 Tax=Amycolatopsis anabasis TaxID=1840409 RepID=UPI00131D1FA7|nr:alpha/beta hydrolase family protein [Amycolatopsis anabasis]